MSPTFKLQEGIITHRHVIKTCELLVISEQLIIIKVKIHWYWKQNKNK